MIVVHSSVSIKLWFTIAFRSNFVRQRKWHITPKGRCIRNTRHVKTKKIIIWNIKCRQKFITQKCRHNGNLKTVSFASLYNALHRRVISHAFRHSFNLTAKQSVRTIWTVKLYGAAVIDRVLLYRHFSCHNYCSVNTSNQFSTLSTSKRASSSIFYKPCFTSNFSFYILHAPSSLNLYNWDVYV